ncbi:MAG: hypothetical protein RLZ23_925 [Actinomycetota bacterium]
MTPKKPDWFELTDGENSPAQVRRINKKLPIAAVVAAGVIIVAGSLFANANDEPSASADTPATSQSASASASATGFPTPTTTASGMNSLPVPTVTNVPKRGDGDHDGRERGDHHDGDHHDGDRPEHDD